MTDRADFLERIRTALGRRAEDPTPSPPALDESRVRRVSSEEPRLERFLSEVRAVGGETIVAPAALLPSSVAARLVELGVPAAVVDSSAERLGLAEACRRAGVTPVALADAPESAAGITTARAAVAETGTVILDAARGEPRGTSLLPAVHVAVVLESQILPDLVDALRLEGESPSSRVWVTGPSKTADIEGILITGVHGPGRWIVAVAEESQRPAEARDSS